MSICGAGAIPGEQDMRWKEANDDRSALDTNRIGKTYSASQCGRLGMSGLVIGTGGAGNRH